MSRKGRPVVGKDIEGPEMPLDMLVDHHWREYRTLTADAQRIDRELATMLVRYGLIPAPDTSTQSPRNQRQPPRDQPPLFDLPSA